jgi:hypothetical protein
MESKSSGNGVYISRVVGFWAWSGDYYGENKIFCPEISPSWVNSEKIDILLLTTLNLEWIRT